MSLKVRVAIALCLAVLAAAIVAGYASSVRSEAAGQRAGALARYGGETAPVCVSSRDISRGEAFSERNVQVVEWLVDLLPDGAIDDPEKVLGRAAASAIAGNTPLASVDVEAQDEAIEVPAGLVAVSVPCSNENAVGGALAPGSAVDVYAVSDGSAYLLCPEVQVLQTNASGTMASLSWATVAVKPEEVEALIAASSLQRLHFVLPSEEETKRRAEMEAGRAARTEAPENGAEAGEGAAGSPDSPAEAQPPAEDGLRPEGAGAPVAEAEAQPAWDGGSPEGAAASEDGGVWQEGPLVDDGAQAWDGGLSEEM